MEDLDYFYNKLKRAISTGYTQEALRKPLAQFQCMLASEIAYNSEGVHATTT